MPVELKNTVPWGRTLQEYKDMFNLSESDLVKKIISFGDGPACFNFEMTQNNKRVISIDPIYQFSTDEINQRISETKDIIVEQLSNNLDKFVWTEIKDVDELAKIRLSAMNSFIKDFEKGKYEGRYINHELPNKTKFGDLEFDLGLSSHFLLLYSQLGEVFHINSITEMLRVSKEVRIFPIINLNAEKTELLDNVISHFSKNYKVCVEKTDYEFQKGGNEMLVIKR